MFNSLHSKITAVMFMMVIMGTAVAVFLAGGLMMQSHMDSVEKQLEATGASLLAAGIRDFSELGDFEYLNTFIEGSLQMEEVDKVIRVFDSSRKLIYTSVKSVYDTLPSSLDQPITKPTFITMKGLRDEYKALVVPYRGRSKQFYLQVVIPLPRYSEIFSSFAIYSVISLGFFLIVALVLSNMLSRRLTRPIRAVAIHLQTLDPTRIERWKPIEMHHGQYLGPITDSINNLISRTRIAVLRLRRISRFVAHELRTPLTILQGEAETALIKDGATENDYREVLESSIEEIGRMSEIVSTVLKVGEEERIIKSFQPHMMDIRLWLEENLKKWEKTLGREIDFKYEAVGRASVNADPKLLFRLVDNLIRNVREHAPEGSRCSLRLLKPKGRAVLVVSDDGPGMPESDLAILNDPSALYESVGVGLSLCMHIAEICRIDISFANLKTGGLEATIRF